jgi:hypothetical protein
LTSEFPLNVKTSTQICSVFGGMLIECKNLQGLSDKEMLAYVGIPFFKMPHVTLHFFFRVYLPKTVQVSAASGGGVGERLNGAMLAQALAHIKRKTILSKI